MLIKMFLAKKIEELPDWGKTLLALVIGFTFCVVFPTVDSGTDISLGGGLIWVSIKFSNFNC